MCVTEPCVNYGLTSTRWNCRVCALLLQKIVAREECCGKVVLTPVIAIERLGWSSRQEEHNDLASRSELVQTETSVSSPHRSDWCIRSWCMSISNTSIWTTWRRSVHVLWRFTFSYYSNERFVLCSHRSKWHALMFPHGIMRVSNGTQEILAHFIPPIAGLQWCRMSVPILKSVHVLRRFTFSFYSNERFVLCSHSCKWHALRPGTFAISNAKRMTLERWRKKKVRSDAACQCLAWTRFMLCANLHLHTHTHHLLHTVTDHLSRIIFHTQLCHTLSFTHTHTTFTHAIFHTQLCHTHTHTIFLCHTPSFTHNFVTHTHTIFLCHTQLCHTHTHTPSFFVTHQLSHATLSHTTSTTSFVFPSFPVPATTFLADYWKKLTCGVIRSFIFYF